jgi:hypothetical protein
LLFLQLGTLYAWGVFQAELANQKLGNSVVLSAIGGVSGFCTALGCLPVGSRGLIDMLKVGNPSRDALWSTKSRLCIRLDRRVLSASIELLDTKCCRSDPGTWGRTRLGERSWLYCKFARVDTLIIQTAYTIPSQYFLKRRGLSTGLASCGAGIGGAAVALVSRAAVIPYDLTRR